MTKKQLSKAAKRIIYYARINSSSANKDGILLALKPLIAGYYHSGKVKSVTPAEIIRALCMIIEDIIEYIDKAALGSIVLTNIRNDAEKGGEEIQRETVYKLLQLLKNSSYPAN